MTRDSTPFDGTTLDAQSLDLRTAESGRETQYTRFAGVVCREPDLRSARRAVVSQAARCLATPWVGLTQHGPPRDVAFVAESGPVVSRIGHIVRQVHEGPSWQVYADASAVVLVPDLARERRWPKFRHAVLSELPVRSTLAIRLGWGERADGALLLYSDHAGHFDDDRRAAARAFADEAGLGLSVVAGRDKCRNLEIALRTSREIGIAIGIVMDRLRISEAEAFELLRAASQRSQLKVRDLAARIALTGELPTPAPGDG